MPKQEGGGRVRRIQILFAVSTLLAFGGTVISADSRAVLEPVKLCFASGRSPASFDLKGQTVNLDCVRANFVPLGGRSGYEIVVELVFDVSSLPALVEAEVRNNVPGSSCNDHFQVKAVNVSPRNGSLAVEGYLGYEKWACASWDWPCCSGLFDCRMCRQEVTTKLFEVSPFYSGRVTPTVDAVEECADDPGSATQALRIQSDGSVSSGLSRDQEFLVGAIGTLIGSIAMGTLGGVAGALITGDILRQANSVGFNTELTFPFLPDSGPFKQGGPRETVDDPKPTVQPEFVLCARSARFVLDPDLGKLTLVVERAGRKAYSLARDFRSALVQQQKLAESDQLGKIEMAVKKGEGWWHIAERQYGDGRYYMSLVAANPQIPARQLYPGDRILVPGLRDIISNPRTVRAGDSLWTIAERVLGDGSRWRELFDERFSSNPDLIFPASPTKR